MISNILLITISSILLILTTIYIIWALIAIIKTNGEAINFNQNINNKNYFSQEKTC